MDPNYPPTRIGAALAAAALPVILPSPSASVRHLEETWPLRLAHWWEQPGTELSVNPQSEKIHGSTDVMLLTREGERWGGIRDHILQ